MITLVFEYGHEGAAIRKAAAAPGGLRALFGGQLVQVLRSAPGAGPGGVPCRCAAVPGAGGSAGTNGAPPGSGGGGAGSSGQGDGGNVNAGPGGGGGGRAGTCPGCGS